MAGFGSRTNNLLSVLAAFPDTPSPQEAYFSAFISKKVIIWREGGIDGDLKLYI